jgi:putative flippase GtrA
MKQLRRELKRFVIAGSLAVGTDMLVYYLLLRAMSHSPAKAASFLCGSIVAYVVNKYWTFEQHERSYAEMVRFGLLYVTTLGANVGVNKICLLLFPPWVFFAFLCATGVSTILNFVGQKWWVFRRERMCDE